METRRLIPIIAAGEGLLVLIAVAWAWAIDLPLPLGDVPSGVLWGVAAAIFLAVVNLALLRWADHVWPGSALREVCRNVVSPLFEHVRSWHILLVSALAGLGEELLFRGVLQPLTGLAVASLLFGAMHVGGRGFIGYGLWAACIGAFMGWLTLTTDGLTAAVVAHGVYDAVALAYVRFGTNHT